MAALPSDHSHRPRTILLVDDAVAVRTATTRLLAVAGFNVLSAASAAEGMALFAANSGEIDLLITDLSMPGMNGLELAEAVRSEAPGLPVIITSALPEEGESALAGPFARLTKPFEFGALLTTVRGLTGLAG